MEQTQAANEAPMSEEDLKWLATVQPEALQPIARRHGRAMFACCWNAGVIGEALGRLLGTAQHCMKWGQKRYAQQIMQAVQVLQFSIDQITKQSIQGQGKELKHFVECKQDIERTMSLLQGGKQVQEGEKVSRGGIILDS